MNDNLANFHIPPQMKVRPNFVLWRLETDDGGRLRKVPYSAHYHGKASTTDRRSWATYEKARQVLETGKYDGLGFCLDQGICFIDLDHCIGEDGTMTPLAKNIVDHFQDTFIEKSQSGFGIHIFALGTTEKAIKTKDIEMILSIPLYTFSSRNLSSCLLQ